MKKLGLILAVLLFSTCAYADSTTKGNYENKAFSDWINQTELNHTHDLDKEPKLQKSIGYVTTIYKTDSEKVKVRSGASYNFNTYEISSMVTVDIEPDKPIINRILSIFKKD